MSADFMIMLAKKFPLIQYVKQEGSFASHVISDLISKGSGAFTGIMGGMAAKFIIDEHSRGACGNMPGSYIVDIQVKVWDLLEAGELDEAWFAKPVVGGQNYPANCANSGYRLFLIQMSSHISKARGVAGKQGLMQR